MRLRDTVDIFTATMVPDEFSGEDMPDWNLPVMVAADVPAEVSYRSVALTKAPGPGATGYTLDEKLACVLDPRPLDPIQHRIRWQGKNYLFDGPPKTRNRNGSPHHVTVHLLDTFQQAPPT